MTMWKRCKHYINKHKIGAVVTRQDFLHYLYQGSIPTHSTYGTGGDRYRRILAMVGILKIVARGQYQILYHIKKDISSTEVNQLAYGKSYRQWFNDVKVER